MTLRHPMHVFQRGLSLIELMIAIALGVVLLLGLIQIFGGVRASFNAADARARIQENGRFAMEFLRRDARMSGHLGCQNEFYHFPSTAIRPIEPGFNGASSSGFYNHLVARDGASIRDNAPYTTHIHRPVEVYNYNATSPGDATYVIASATPAPDGNAANWTPALPNAANQLNGIASLAIPGSDIVVFRYFDEETVTLRSPAVTQAGVITLGAAAAGIQRFALYGLTECNVASLFQITAAPAATTVTAASGGLNLQRDGSGNWFTNAYVNYGEGTMMHRYRFVVYYVGVGTNGPALMRRTLIQAPTAAAQGTQLAPAEEVIEGVEMMQILVGVDTDTPREDFVNAYRSPSVHLAGATTPALVDDRLRQISSLRISLLLRGNASQSNAQRARDTIVVGDINVTLPTDGRARQTYDTTVAVRNRLRA